MNNGQLLRTKESFLLDTGDGSLEVDAYQVRTTRKGLLLNRQPRGKRRYMRQASVSKRVLAYVGKPFRQDKRLQVPGIGAGVRFDIGDLVREPYCRRRAAGRISNERSPFLVIEHPLNSSIIIAFLRYRECRHGRLVKGVLPYIRQCLGELGKCGKGGAALECVPPDLFQSGREHCRRELFALCEGVIPNDCYRLRDGTFCQSRTARQSGLVYLLCRSRELDLREPGELIEHIRGYDILFHRLIILG